MPLGGGRVGEGRCRSHFTFERAVLGSLVTCVCFDAVAINPIMYCTILFIFSHASRGAGA